MTRWGVFAASFAMVLPALAWNLGSLVAALLLLGFSLGSLDIAMNTAGRRDRARLRPSDHVRRPRPVQRRRAGRRGAGMTLAVLAPDPAVAIAAYEVLCLGVATIVPIAFTLAGTAPGVPPAWGISRVTTLGYAGLFCSPPVIGLVAQVIGLTAALAIPALLLLLVAPLSRVVSAGSAWRR